MLTGSGGITGVLPALEASLFKATGTEVLYDADPIRLVDRLLERFLAESVRTPTDEPEPSAR